MGMGWLVRGELRRYLKESRDNPSDLWFFLHIPKTAGSSFRSELAGRLQPDSNIFITYDDSAASHEELLDRAVSGFLASMTHVRPRFASGHIYRSHIERIKRLRPDVKLVTMLRDPVRRVVSDYRYQRTPAHPPHQAFIRAFPDFQSYLACVAEQNKMHHYLSRYPGQPVDEVIEEMEREFVFVGTQELYELSCRVLFALLGRLELPFFYDRRTADTVENRVGDVELLRPQVEALNALDVRIYRHFAERLRTVKAKMETELPELVGVRP